MFASPASTTFRISNGSTPSWSELIEPDVYCASRIARGPNRAPGRWLTASSNGAPMIATSTSGGELGRIRDPGQVHEGRRADVRRQVVVAECLERLVPAVGARRSPGGSGSWGRSATESSGDRLGQTNVDAFRVSSRWGRRPFEISRPAGRAELDGSTRALGMRSGVSGTPAQAASTCAGSPNRSYGGLRDERRRDHRVVGSRGGGCVAEPDRVVRHALLADRRAPGGSPGRPG